MKDWYIYKGDKTISDLPDPPPWRTFEWQHAGQPLIERDPPAEPQAKRRFGPEGRGRAFQADEKVIELVNSAIYLRRPLLVTGRPGIGKSTLAYSIALELRLGRVLRWSITSRSVLKDGLYSYDAIGRLQEANLHQDADHAPPIDPFITLGPLGTTLLPTARPRVLLIDEIDKSDIDLPNDLLNVFEEGQFEIAELVRQAALHEEEEDDEPRPAHIRPHDARHKADTVPIYNGRIICNAFPIVILTSNGERELPPAFLRRCLRLQIQPPNEEQMLRIVEAHFQDIPADKIAARNQLIKQFLTRRDQQETELLATDQLLNAIYLMQSSFELGDPKEKAALINDLFKSLTHS